ncbi:MAG TPA: acetate kinase, partial [Tenericutes bacterium]|nr:acetate kinase [Mycoplasmatota bacterium]
MEKFLVINAGSSSLKFQVYDMPKQIVKMSGYFEKIGQNDSFYTLKFNEKKEKKIVFIPNHEEAVKIL